MLSLTRCRGSQPFAIGLSTTYPGLAAHGVDFIPALLYTASAYGPALVIMGFLASETVSRLMIAMKKLPPGCRRPLTEDEQAEAMERTDAELLARNVSEEEEEEQQQGRAALHESPDSGRSALVVLYGIVHFVLLFLLAMCSVPWGAGMGDTAVSLALAPALPWLGLETGNVDGGLDDHGRPTGSSWLFWHPHWVLTTLLGMTFSLGIVVIVMHLLYMGGVFVKVIQLLGVKVRLGKGTGRTSSTATLALLQPAAQWHGIRLDVGKAAAPAGSDLFAFADSLFKKAKSVYRNGLTLSGVMQACKGVLSLMNFSSRGGFQAKFALGLLVQPHPIARVEVRLAHALASLLSPPPTLGHAPACATSSQDSL